MKTRVNRAQKIRPRRFATTIFEIGSFFFVLGNSWRERSYIDVMQDYAEKRSALRRLMRANKRAEASEFLRKHPALATAHPNGDANILCDCMHFGFYELAEELISNFNVDVNEPNGVRHLHRSLTPLHLALRLGWLRPVEAHKLVALLLKAGARVDVEADGSTLIHSLALSPFGRTRNREAERIYIEFARDLIERGVDPQKLDKDGKTASEIILEFDSGANAPNLAKFLAEA